MGQKLLGGLNAHAGGAGVGPPLAPFLAPLTAAAEAAEAAATVMAAAASGCPTSRAAALVSSSVLASASFSATSAVTTSSVDTASFSCTARRRFRPRCATRPGSALDPENSPTGAAEPAAMTGSRALRLWQEEEEEEGAAAVGARITPVLSREGAMVPVSGYLRTAAAAKSVKSLQPDAAVGLIKSWLAKRLSTGVRASTRQ